MTVATADVSTPLPFEFHAPRYARIAALSTIDTIPVSTYGGTGWHVGVRTWPMIVEPGSVVLDAFDRVPELFGLIEQIRETVLWLPAERAGAGRAMRAFLSDVAPGGRIDRHVDEMPRAGRRRFHAVLATNEHAWFTIDTELGAVSWRMEPGRIYEIDPRAPHAVFNGGATHRLHLVVDCARGDG